MIQQPSDRPTGRAVRDGHVAVVTCSACGCRLKPDDTRSEWTHFGALSGRDAMGHRPPCAEFAHDGSGRAALTA